MRNPLTLEAFADFCDAQGERGYDYFDNLGCAAFQWLKASGFAVASVGGDYWRDQSKTDHPFPDGWTTAIVRLPHTFPALAKRLRESANV